MDAQRVPGVAGAAREAAPWVRRLARLGYAAKGAVYLLVGGLAVAAAIGSGRVSGSSGALATIADSAAGRAVLGLIAVGLAGYAVWGVVRAGLDPEHDGAGKRAFYLVSAVLYGLLAVEAARLALDGGGTAGGEGASHWSATLLGQPFGRWLLMAVGLVVAGFGLQQIASAWRADLDDRLALGRLGPGARRWTIRFGRFGIAARGLVIAIIGGYFVLAGVQSDPSEVRDLGDVLALMAGTPWLLALVGAGLAAYGLYNFVRARYRTIKAA